MKASVLGVALVMFLGGTAAACSEGGDGGSGDVVEVELKDFDVTLSTDSTESGEVTFAATNDGPSVHEIEIFEVTDESVDPNALPVENGVAVTDGLTLLDEIEDILAGGSAELTVSLEPGSYAVVCNLPDHYGQGMHASLTVG